MGGQEVSSVKAEDKQKLEGYFTDKNDSLPPFSSMVKDQPNCEKVESAPCLDEHAFAEALFKAGQTLPKPITKEVAAKQAKFIVKQAKTAKDKCAVKDFMIHLDSMHKQSFTAED